MIREYKLTFQLKCGHDAAREAMYWHELESKWNLMEYARGMVGGNGYCRICDKENKISGFTLAIEDIIYRDRKEWREVNYPADKWLDVLP